MKLGDLPPNVVRMAVPRTDLPGVVFVRFTCRVCNWTTAFSTTEAGVSTITPDHPCPAWEERQRQVREHEMGPARVVYDPGRPVYGEGYRPPRTRIIRPIGGPGFDDVDDGPGPEVM